jgi:hypothetical protein
MVKHLKVDCTSRNTGSKPMNITCGQEKKHDQRFLFLMSYKSHNYPGKIDAINHSPVEYMVVIYDTKSPT